MNITKEDSGNPRLAIELTSIRSNEFQYILIPIAVGLQVVSSIRNTGVSGAVARRT